MSAPSAWVISLRAAVDSASGSDSETAQFRRAVRCRAAIERASAMGARVVASTPVGPCFALDEPEVFDVVEFALAFAKPDGDEPGFAVGIGEGSLFEVGDHGPYVRLAIGSALSRAIGLARLAGEGEVLVDQTLAEISSGSLLTLGRRVATDDSGHRFRGAILDLDEPWRRERTRVQAVSHPSRIVGREAALDSLCQVGAGGLGIVRAPAGHGGTRLLEEIATRAAASLFVSPSGVSVEPLSALRLACARFSSQNQSIVQISRERAHRSDPPERQRSRTSDRPISLTQRELGWLQALVGHEGIDIDSASLLIGSLLQPRPGFHPEAGTHLGAEDRLVLVLDDAALVDRASLEAIGLAASSAGAAFAVIVRLDLGDPLPGPLSTLVVESDVSLRPLLPHESAMLIEDAFAEVSISEELGRRWVRRGGGIPLALIESLRLAAFLGELTVRDNVVVPRSKLAGRGRALSAHAWVSRRLDVLENDQPADASLLGLLGVAGPSVHEVLVAKAFEELGFDDPNVSITRLIGSDFVVRELGLLSPSSRTLADAVRERTNAPARRRLHMALSTAFTRFGQGLELAEAAHHAALAGDALGAASLAHRSAQRARRVGLTSFADDFDDFAQSTAQDLSSHSTRRSPPPSATQSPAPPSVLLNDNEGPPDTEDLSAVINLIGLNLGHPARSESHVPPSVDPRIVWAVDRSVDTPSLGVEHLRTHEIASLPIEPPMDIDSPAAPVSPEASWVNSRSELHHLASSGAEPQLSDTDEHSLPPSFRVHTIRDEGPKDHYSTSIVADMTDGRWAAAEETLTASGLIGAKPDAVFRLRALCALGLGDMRFARHLVEKTRGSSRGHATAARNALARAIVLGASGHVAAAVAEALEALGHARTTDSELGERACQKVLQQLLGPLA